MRMAVTRYLSIRNKRQLMVLVLVIGSFLWILTRENHPLPSVTSTFHNYDKNANFVYGETKYKSSDNPYRVMAENCSVSLELPLGDIKAKISSYEFPGVDPYIKDLFPNAVLSSPPEFPYFVTALSSNHYKEGQAWLKSFNKIPRERYPNLTLYVYDIGLSDDEAAQIRYSCNCTFRKFPFERYPEHVRLLRVYAWKPIIIQLVVNEHPFVIWMDTSVEFLEPDIIYHLIIEAKSKGVLAAKSPAKIANRVFQDTFEVLKEEPCLYQDLNIFGARFVVAYVTSFELNYLLKPWVSCALMRVCIVTNENPDHIIDCNRRREEFSFKCHRFDQGVLSILMHRLYHKRASDHFITKINGINVIHTQRM